MHPPSQSWVFRWFRSTTQAPISRCIPGQNPAVHIVRTAIRSAGTRRKARRSRTAIRFRACSGCPSPEPPARPDPGDRLSSIFSSSRWLQGELMLAGRRLMRVTRAVGKPPHAGYECGAGPGRDLLLPVRLQLVFFNVRCTVITETRSTQPSSTTFSANRRRVQRVRPGGAGEQAKATRRASNAPSKITFSLQGKLQPLLHKPPLQVLDGAPRRPAPPPPGPRSIPALPPAVAQQQCPRVQEPLTGGLGRGPGQCLQFRPLFLSERDTIAWCGTPPSEFSSLLLSIYA